MPQAPVLPVLLARPADVAEWAFRRLSGPFDPVPEQVVTVRKPGHGVRPVAELYVRDQLLYRTFVNAWNATLGPPTRSSAAFDEFESAPLQDPAIEYVVSSDIACFYQYVDYDLLSRELLARTGDAERVECVECLTEAGDWVGRLVVRGTTAPVAAGIIRSAAVGDGSGHHGL